jgi:phosphoribosylformylglycinamidine synthase
MRFAVLQFPASNCDQDVVHALQNVLGHDAYLVWHKDEDLRGADAVIIPGGFSFGDYLRCGAIARFSPVMARVQEFAKAGGVVLGICNGFQVLCEAGLLPGALIRNRSLQFRCEHVFLRTTTRRSAFTRSIPENRILRIPIAHGEGCYFADDATLEMLKSNDQILWEYCDPSGQVTDAANPNGSVLNIAGICNEARNVAGLMPHPDRACEPILGSADGLLIFESLLAELTERHVTRRSISLTVSALNCANSFAVIKPIPFRIASCITAVDRR